LKDKLIKIGAKVVSHGRYIAFQMAEVAIRRQMFLEILRLIAELRPKPPPARPLACYGVPRGSDWLVDHGGGTKSSSTFSAPKIFTTRVATGRGSQYPYNNDAFNKYAQ
jgi:hypothetical protein